MSCKYCHHGKCCGACKDKEKRKAIDAAKGKDGAKGKKKHKKKHAKDGKKKGKKAK